MPSPRGAVSQLLPSLTPWRGSAQLAFSDANGHRTCSACRAQGCRGPQCLQDSELPGPNTLPHPDQGLNKCSSSGTTQRRQSLAGNIDHFYGHRKKLKFGLVKPSGWTLGLANCYSHHGKSSAKWVNLGSMCHVLFIIKWCQLGRLLLPLPFMSVAMASLALICPLDMSDRS